MKHYPDLVFKDGLFLSCPITFVVIFGVSSQKLTYFSCANFFSIKCPLFFTSFGLFSLFLLPFIHHFRLKMSFSLFCENMRNKPFFRYFASPKFATFSHLFASSENLGNTLSQTTLASKIKPKFIVPNFACSTRRF
jgi:ATP/ADP translocase